MARRTIDFGIDLGTTNSEIACCEQGRVRVFDNYLQEKYTPSVVHIDAAGTLTVGRNAYNLAIRDPENTASEFKRFMGTTHQVLFKDSGRSLASEELSAEVLKELKATIKDSLPEEGDLRAAVITVPANFELRQCAATQQAARLAGIEVSPLLQEPIAASIAYGLLERLPKGYWMIYDLGGGTFDVALMSVRDKQLMVVDHAGDNDLGGKDIDWEIVEHIIWPALQQQYQLPGLVRGEKRYRDLEAHAKQVAEQAKIALSRRESVTVALHPERARDANGQEISLSIVVTRSALEGLLGPYVERTVRLCQEMLERQRLSHAALERILLVGGPTLTPYIRESLRATFGVPIESGADPLTVVAQGAAVFAARQLMPEALVQRPTDKVYIRLEYSPLVAQTMATVGGRLEWPVGTQATYPVIVQVRREDGGWQSGRLEVKGETVILQVPVKENSANTFMITLSDTAGRNIACSPDSFTITHGLAIGDPPLTRSVGVELANGSFRPHLQRGQTLPKSCLIKYRTAKSLMPGSSEVLKIKLYEGEFPVAKHNRHIDTLEISGRDVDKALPEGSEIDVTVAIDQSRVPTIGVFLPRLDKQIRKPAQIKISDAPDPATLDSEFHREQERIAQIRTLCEDYGDRKLIEAIEVGCKEQLVDEIAREIAAAQGGDPGAAHKADSRLKELKAAGDSLESVIAWPRAMKEHRETLEQIRPLINALGTTEEQARLQAYEEDAKAVLPGQNPKRLEAVTEKMLNLYWRIQFRRDEFWIATFQELATGKQTFGNQPRAAELLQEGGRALQRNDIDSLKSVTTELWNLIDRADQIKLGGKIDSDAGIR